MKPRNLSVILFILLFVTTITRFVAAESKCPTVTLDFTQIGEGGLLVCEKDDKTYSVVIKSYEGFQNFKNQYPIEFNLSKEDFINSIYIVGFSDNYWAIAADGFKRRHLPSYYYYLDIADLGVDIDVVPLPEGKKYSGWVVIKVNNNLEISDVQLREGVLGGLTNWF